MMKYIYSIVLLVCGAVIEVSAAEVQHGPPPMEPLHPLDLRRLIHQVTPAELATTIHAMLRTEADKFKEHENFSTVASYTRSLENWKERCCYLKAAIALGDHESQAIYEKEIESKRYFLETYDCLVAGYEAEYDPRTVLAFYWEQVAQEDPHESAKLQEAYQQERAVRLDKK